MHFDQDLTMNPRPTESPASFIQQKKKNGDDLHSRSFKSFSLFSIILSSSPSQGPLLCFASIFVLQVIKRIRRVAARSKPKDKRDGQKISLFRSAFLLARFWAKHTRTSNANERNSQRLLYLSLNLLLAILLPVFLSWFSSSPSQNKGEKVNDDGRGSFPLSHNSPHQRHHQKVTRWARPPSSGFRKDHQKKREGWGFWGFFLPFFQSLKKQRHQLFLHRAKNKVTALRHQQTEREEGRDGAREGGG